MNIALDCPLVIAQKQTFALAPLLRNTPIGEGDVTAIDTIIKPTGAVLIRLSFAGLVQTYEFSSTREHIILEAVYSGGGKRRLPTKKDILRRFPVQEGEATATIDDLRTVAMHVSWAIRGL